MESSDLGYVDPSFLVDSVQNARFAGFGSERHRMIECWPSLWISIQRPRLNYLNGSYIGKCQGKPIRSIKPGVVLFA